MSLIISDKEKCALRNALSNKNNLIGHGLIRQNMRITKNAKIVSISIDAEI